MAQQRQTPGQPETIRVPLLGSYSNRSSSASTDQRFVNMFPETKKVEQLDNTKIFINKRPGLSLYKNFGTGEGRGCIYFHNKFYVIVGNTVYEDGSPPIAKITLTASSGPVSMINANSSTLGDYIFICDGTSGWIIKTDGTATKITDVDFPSPHVPAATFIDGYVAVAKGSDVYTCDVDNPLSWTPSNFLSAEMFPDPIQALARQNNQVVVLGTSSIEFFYDAANAAGSPLSRNDSTTIQMGCAAPYCVYQNEKYCAYVAQSDSGGRAVWLIDGFQPKKVSDEFIERILDSETSINTCRGFGLRTKGHLFYVINLKGIGRTLVYDVDEKLWHEWSSNNAGNHNVFGCDYQSDNASGASFLLHSSNGNLYKLDPTVYQDDTTPIICEVVTNRFDMDTHARKFMSSCKIVCDWYSTSNPISLYWTDNDYQSWSNEKVIDLNDGFPAFQRLGTFRRRAFKLRHTTNNNLRLESLEVVYTKGIG